MAATMIDMNKVDCILIKHSCGHEITAPACYMQPHRVRNEERRPCAQCRDQERAGAAMRNWQRGLPQLDGSRCSPRQMLLAEELRERFGWQLERGAAAKATDPIWWIAEYAAQAREEDAAEEGRSERKAQSSEQWSGCAARDEKRSSIVAQRPQSSELCALSSEHPEGPSASPAEVVAAPAPNLTAEEKAAQDAQFDRIFGDGPRDPEPPTGGDGGEPDDTCGACLGKLGFWDNGYWTECAVCHSSGKEPRACRTCGQVEGGEVALVEREGWLLCVPCADDGPEPSPEPCSVDVEMCPACCETRPLLDCGRCADCCDCKARPLEEETMETVRRQTTEAEGSAVLSRQTVEAAALYSGCAEELEAALHSQAGAGERWATHRSTGLTNEELRQAIGQEFGIGWTASAPGVGYQVAGMPTPRFWRGRGGGRPRLQGPALVAACRELLQIPKPREAAAVAAAPAGSAAPDARLLSFFLIHPSPLNPRKTFDKTALEELAQSILDHGLLQPLVVRPAGKEFELIAGERRLRAAGMAGLGEVPAIVLEGLSDEQALALMLVENLQRADLNPIEEASAYQQLSEMGMTQEQIAARVGRSRPAVANAMRLLKLPEAVRQMVAEAKLTAAHGAALLHWAEQPQRCEHLASCCLAETLASKDLERMARDERELAKRRQREEAREAKALAEAGSKGGAVAAREARWEQQRQEAKAAEEAWRERTAERAEALRDAREGAGPILADPHALALITERVLYGVPLGVLQPILTAAGFEELAALFDWRSQQPREAKWEALAVIPAEELFGLLFRVQAAYELAGWSDAGRNTPRADWYVARKGAVTA